MSKLSKSSIYAIKYLFSQGFTAEQIASEINLSVDNIQSVIEAENLIKQPPTAKDLMINQTAVKRTNSVSIMTKEASKMNDSDRTKFTSQKNSTEHIFRPFSK